MLHVAPLAASWGGGHRGALWRQEQDIRALAEAFGATVIFIDSVVTACGGADPLDPGTPARYAGSCEYFGRPVLSLAHVTKEGSHAYPFGSVFWHNLARMTWSLERDGPRLSLVNRKANNYGHAGRFTVTTTWHENQLGEVSEQGYSAALAERIDDVLGFDDLTVAAIVERLSEDLDEDEQAPKPDSIRKALRRAVQGRTHTIVTCGSARQRTRT